MKKTDNIQSTGKKEETTMHTFGILIWLVIISASDHAPLPLPMSYNDIKIQDVNSNFTRQHEDKYSFGFSKQTWPGRQLRTGLGCAGVTVTYKCIPQGFLYADWVISNSTYLPSYQSCLDMILSKGKVNYMSPLSATSTCSIWSGSIESVSGLALRVLDGEYDRDTKYYRGVLLKGGICNAPPCILNNNMGYWIADEWSG